METIEIKSVTITDINLLQQISRQTFYETFAASNTTANMVEYLKESFSTDKLTNELSTPGSQFYFALSGEDVIGYLKVNIGGAQTELKAENGLEIERIYVLQQYHGKKVGQLLYEKAIQFAQEIDAAYVWLGVWEENQRALRFYSKNGFIEFDKHIFTLGEDEQIDIMMKKNIEVIDGMIIPDKQ